MRMAVEVVEGAEEADRLTVAEGMMLDGVLDKINNSTTWLDLNN